MGYIFSYKSFNCGFLFIQMNSSVFHYGYKEFMLVGLIG